MQTKIFRTLAATAAVLGLAAVATGAQARTSVYLGFNAPIVAPYVQPAPVYVQPAPVYGYAAPQTVYVGPAYVAPPVVVVRPAPVYWGPRYYHGPRRHWR